MKDNIPKKSILVIDDDIWIQRIVCGYIESWGIKAFPALDPYSGLSLASSEKPDLILLDIVLPDISGDKLLKMIRHIESISNIPVVIISSYLSRNVFNIAIKHGVKTFISKPITKETLKEKITIDLGENFFYQNTA